MLFLAVDGQGNPNEADGEYQKAVEALYAIAFTIKMSKMGSGMPVGYFEYIMPPLEGLWWLSDDSDMDFYTYKERYQWTSLIRQPEFVTEDVLRWAREEVHRKKPNVDTFRVRLLTFTEGLCVQALHIGPFDMEPETIHRIETFIQSNGLLHDIGSLLPSGVPRRHHEIYMSDPRKTSSEKMKTVLRHPLKRTV